VAYLMVMFSIIMDLFRDRDASGWEKAAWVVALIILPFFTALIYLITRGRRMNERSAATAQQMQQRQDSYIRDVAGSASPVDQIAQAKTMLDSGVINQAEFDTLKAKALA
jgi:hypothetical protein